MVLDIAKVRAQFPALALTDRGGPRVYFDNPAGTQVPQIVVDRMVSALIDSNANMNGNFRTFVLLVLFFLCQCLEHTQGLCLQFTKNIVQKLVSEKFLDNKVG